MNFKRDNDIPTAFPRLTFRTKGFYVIECEAGSLIVNGGGMNDQWPSLNFQEWKDTYATLHMLTQIVGKIRLTQSPWVNHSWHTTLYVTSRGLTTSPIPYGSRTFQIDFDFIDHNLLIEASDGGVKTIALSSRPVADFYEELFNKLAELNLKVKIHTM